MKKIYKMAGHKREGEPGSAENEPGTKEGVIESILQEFYDPADHESVRKTLANSIELVDREGVTLLLLFLIKGRWVLRFPGIMFWRLLTNP